MYLLLFLFFSLYGPHNRIIEHIWKFAGPQEDCGGLGQIACTSGEECQCGLLKSSDGTCEDTGAGCMDVGAISSKSIPVSSSVTPTGADRHDKVARHHPHFVFAA
jgi:hypothetical protein